MAGTLRVKMILKNLIKWLRFFFSFGCAAKLKKMNRLNTSFWYVVGVYSVVSMVVSKRLFHRLRRQMLTPSIAKESSTVFQMKAQHTHANLRIYFYTIRFQHLIELRCFVEFYVYDITKRNAFNSNFFNSTHFSTSFLFCFYFSSSPMFFLLWPLYSFERKAAIFAYKVSS